MENFEGTPVACKNFIDSPEIEDEVSKKFGENKCLLNAYYTAVTTNDLIVEGILMILENGKVISIVRHGWNKHDDSYYDITKDYVWTKKEFQQKLQKQIQGDISYKYFSCNENKADEYNNVGNIEFKYDYNMLIKSLLEQITNEKLISVK